MDLSKLADLLKLPWHISLTLALICGVVLFAPNTILVWLGLSGLVSTYRGWIGVALLFFLVIPVGNALRFFAVGAQVFVERWRIQQVGKGRLRNLTAQQKAILSYFIDNKT